MFISAVPIEHILEVWPTVEPMIQGALDRAPGRFKSADIFLLLRSGYQTLWIAVDEPKEILAAFVTRVYDLPQGRITSIDWAGGRDHERWVERFDEVITKYAKDNGSNIVEYSGRPGWGKYLKKSGWENTAVIYEKAL